jgi:hypothetical protein
VKTNQMDRGDKMRIPTDPKQREDLLHRLREAVVHQIGLWGALRLICEAIDADRTYVSDAVCAAAITADLGTELSHEDLDDLLGIGVSERIVVGKALNRFDGRSERNNGPIPPNNTSWRLH